MDIIIQSPGFKTSNDQEDYIREKLDKLHPKDQIIRADVTLYIGPQRATPDVYCEIRLEVPGNDLFVKESHRDFEQAVDLSVNKLQDMLRKAKEKQVDRNHGRE